MGRWGGGAVLLLLVQAPGGPSYQPAQFDCATFREIVTSEIRGEVGRAVRRERLGRAGLLVARWSPDSGTVSLWFDSLAVWRGGVGADGRLEPDTEGLLGGRWIGRLSANGDWTETQTPFVPDDVAAVQDLRPLARDFFPRLPGRPLRSGQADTSLGRVIRRERSEGAVQRYSWALERRADTVTALGDTLEAKVHQVVRETGTLTWSLERGPLGWERTITEEIRPSGGAGRARAVALQQIRVERQADRPGCGA